jgi:hypothetical protein
VSATRQQLHARQFDSLQGSTLASDRCDERFGDGKDPFSFRRQVQKTKGPQVTTRRVTIISAAIEAATGAALIADPPLVVRLLVGADLSHGGIAIGRVCGFALLSLGLACWPGAVVTAQAGAALFTYNLLTALYLG